MKNKYEKAFNDLFYYFSTDGFFFKTKQTKIGFSFVEMVEVQNGFDIEPECSFAETQMITYHNWEYFFTVNKDLEFSFGNYNALNDNFITWEEFKDIIDGKIEPKFVC